MNPILYPSTETAFASNGLGVLSGAVSCTVTEELNGSYELTMQYPITGLHYELIQQRSILYAKPTPTAGPQPFRVYRITKPLRGIVTVYAAHLSYDLSGVPLQPYTAGSVQAALVGIETNAAIAHPFTTWSDMTNAGEMAVSVPTSARAVLGSSGGILETYGGELEYDHYAVRLWSARGTDRGMTIRYGKNLTSLEQDENCANVYTGIYPYYVPSEGSIVQLPEKVINAPGTYDFVHILSVDMRDYFEDTPSQAQLREAAERYISEHQIGVPAVSLQVSFAQLEQTEEYKHLTLLERVELGDTVSVAFPALGVSAKARCVKTVYNVLLGRFDSVELGDARTTIADTIANQKIQLDHVPTTTALLQAARTLTNTLLGADGGAIRFMDASGDGQLDTLYIADDPDPEKAVKVWRFNYEGWGASDNGYNGPFVLGATLEFGIVADFITTGSMDAARVTTGLLTSKDGRVQFDLTAGTLYIRDATQNVKLGFDAAGNLTISGYITATGGKIGGFTISGSSLVGTYITLAPDSYGGSLTLGDVTMSGAGGLGINRNVLISGGLTLDYGSSGLSILSGGAEISGNLEVYGSNVYMGNLSSRSVTYDANIRLDTDTGYLYRISSSRRYKKDIHDIREYDSVSDRIDRVRAVTYTGRGTKDAGRYGYGFVAEEMEQEFPWLVEYATENGVIQAESVSYSRTPAILWADAQTTHEKLRALEARLAELEAK